MAWRSDLVPTQTGFTIISSWFRTIGRFHAPQPTLGQTPMLRRFQNNLNRTPESIHRRCPARCLIELRYIFSLNIYNLDWTLIKSHGSGYATDACSSGGGEGVPFSSDRPGQSKHFLLRPHLLNDRLIHIASFFLLSKATLPTLQHPRHFSHHLQ